MRSDIIELLSVDNDYFMFLRDYPHWHQTLSYYPDKINDFFL